VTCSQMAVMGSTARVMPASMKGLRPTLSLRSPTSGAKKKARKVLASRLFRLAQRTTSAWAAWGRKGGAGWVGRVGQGKEDR